jgi:hypothetical protein
MKRKPKFPPFKTIEMWVVQYTDGTHSSPFWHKSDAEANIDMLVAKWHCIRSRMRAIPVRVMRPLTPRPE